MSIDWVTALPFVWLAFIGLGAACVAIEREKRTNDFLRAEVRGLHCALTQKPPALETLMRGLPRELRGQAALMHRMLDGGDPRAGTMGHVETTFLKRGGFAANLCVKGGHARYRGADITHRLEIQGWQFNGGWLITRPEWVRVDPLPALDGFRVEVAYDEPMRDRERRRCDAPDT